MANVEVRAVDAGTLESAMQQAVRVYTEAFASPPLCEDWTSPDAPSVPEMLRGYVVRGMMLLATVDGEPVAIAASEPGPQSDNFALASDHLDDPEASVHIAELCVLPSHQARGVGRIALQELVTRHEGHEMFLRVAVDSLRARRLYHDHDFEDLPGTTHVVRFGRVPGCRDHPGDEDERVIMRRRPTERAR